MAHDVFISYSSVDKTAADTVCSILEQNGTSSWIAPRDITPGVPFAEAIIKAIKESRVFILVYTQNSNISPQVIKEVDRAVHHGLSVITLRLEDVPMSNQLEYYLSDVHWLDAMAPPLEQHIDRLARVVKMLLSKDEVKDEDIEKAISKGTLRLGKTGKPVSGKGRYRSPWIKLGVPVTAIIILLFALLLLVPSIRRNFLDQMGPLDKSVAVLPFTNLSPDPDQDYFSDGMMDEILDRLFKIGDLKVISRTSSMQYRNTDLSIKEIARELGVGAILEGSVRRAGNLVRITVQLIDARNDTHLWSEVYDGDLSDLSNIFSMQSDVAQSVAKELKALISPQEKRLIEKIPDTDLEVYDQYLKSLSYRNDFSRESLYKALEFLNSAVEKDPDLALLYAGLTQVWMGIQQMGYEPPDVAGPKIFENLNKTLELDPDLAVAHYLNAMIAHLVEWNWEKSEKEFLKALAINPNDALSRIFYSQLLAVLQRDDEALEQGKLAYSLDPLNHNMKSWYGATLLMAGDCKTGLSLVEEVIAADQGNILANNGMLMAAYRCKEYDKVLTAEKHLLPFLFEEVAFKEIERIYHDQGIVSAYDEIMKHLEEVVQNNTISPFDLALRYIYANQPDKAMVCIEKAFEIHDPATIYIATKMGNLDPLFSNPRFIDICEKMNLPVPK
ncbi:MAG: TIR domain-containing protein [Bacteroidales bacterium]|nr:TIR domain-containing protein [Bacteroidales bacterium]